MPNPHRAWNYETKFLLCVHTQYAEAPNMKNMAATEHPTARVVYSSLRSYQGQDPTTISTDTPVRVLQTNGLEKKGDGTNTAEHNITR